MFDVKKFNGLVSVDSVIAEHNFSRTHMYLLIDNGLLNVARVQGEDYMTVAEHQRFATMLEVNRAQLAEMFARQDEIRARAIAEVAELFND